MGGRWTGGKKKKPQLCLCACVVRLTYDKLRRILKPYHKLGCRGGVGIHSQQETPPLGFPSPRHLMKERGPLLSRSLTAAWRSALPPKPPTRWKVNPNFGLDPLTRLSKAACTRLHRGCRHATEALGGPPPHSYPWGRVPKPPGWNEGSVQVLHRP